MVVERCVVETNRRIVVDTERVESSQHNIRIPTIHHSSAVVGNITPLCQNTDPLNDGQQEGVVARAARCEIISYGSHNQKHWMQHSRKEEGRQLRFGGKAVNGLSKRTGLEQAISFQKIQITSCPTCFAQTRRSATVSSLKKGCRCPKGVHEKTQRHNGKHTHALHIRRR
jgi:hypothetical protein